MHDAHERFDALAVGHVLGGLDPDDAAAFRSHLPGCRGCRTRVAELRSIAADLAAAERDERERERTVRTDVARRDAQELPPGRSAAGRIGVRHVTVAVIAVALLAGAMGFWNLHLRTTSAAYLTAAEARGDTLAHLARGTPVEAYVAGSATAQAAIDDGVVALTVAGLAPLESGTWLVAWLVDGPGEDVAVRLAGPGQLDDGGVVALSLPIEGAVRLLLTRESGGSTLRPTGPVVVEVPLTEASG